MSIDYSQTEICRLEVEADSELRPLRITATFRHRDRKPAFTKKSLELNRIRAVNGPAALALFIILGALEEKLGLKPEDNITSLTGGAGSPFTSLNEALNKCRKELQDKNTTENWLGTFLYNIEIYKNFILHNIADGQIKEQGDSLSWQIHKPIKTQVNYLNNELTPSQMVELSEKLILKTRALGKAKNKNYWSGYKLNEKLVQLANSFTTKKKNDYCDSPKIGINWNFGKKNDGLVSDGDRPLSPGSELQIVAEHCEKNIYLLWATADLSANTCEIKAQTMYPYNKADFDGEEIEISHTITATRSTLTIPANEGFKILIAAGFEICVAITAEANIHDRLEELKINLSDHLSSYRWPLPQYCLCTVAQEPSFDKNIKMLPERIGPPNAKLLSIANELA